MYAYHSYSHRYGDKRILLIFTPIEHMDMENYKCLIHKDLINGTWNDMVKVFCLKDLKHKLEEIDDEKAMAIRL